MTEERREEAGEATERQLERDASREADEKEETGAPYPEPAPHRRQTPSRVGAVPFRRVLALRSRAPGAFGRRFGAGWQGYRGREACKRDFRGASRRGARAIRGERSTPPHDQDQGHAGRHREPRARGRE